MTAPDHVVATVGDLGQVHLVAIGGAGMSVVAQLLHDRGVAVQGSDAHDGPALRALAAQGVPVWVGHDADHLAGADTVVVSSAVREDNVELAAARAAGLPVLHRSQALALLMADDVAVAVAGAHGKTTTTAMIAVALRELGADPSFAVGAEVVTSQGRTSGGHAGRGGVIVVEADESDGSFLAYEPTVAVVTNVEPDHLDHYGTREAFEDAFVAFARRVRTGGALVVCADDVGSARLAARYAGPGRVVTYGTSPDADLRIEAHEDSSAVLHVPALAPVVGTSVVGTPVVGTPVVGTSVASASTAGTPVASTPAGPATTPVPLRLHVPGLHNLRDAAAAVAVLVLLGHGAAAATRAVEGFRGTGRRFELRGTVGGVRVVDDYAHHPTEVAALLGAARAVAGQGSVHVLFQPHLFSRTRRFARQFAEALALADDAVVCDVYAAREDPDPAVGPTTITALAPAGADLSAVGDRDTAARAVADRAVPGDLVLTVGAGDVTQAADVVLDRLRERLAGSPTGAAWPVVSRADDAAGATGGAVLDEGAPR